MLNDALRPAIRDDVVCRYDQDEIVRLQAKQTGTKEGTAFEVERTPRLFKQQFVQLLLAIRFRKLCQSNDRQREFFLGCDNLDQFAILLCKIGTQDLVSIN